LKKERLTQPLQQSRAGDRKALVYKELRRLAGSYLRNQAPGLTRQPTALVHEAYLKPMPWATLQRSLRELIQPRIGVTK